MTYISQQQEMFYRDRIGKVYGCFEVTNVEYDQSCKRQLWTLKCVHCGAIKTTYNGKDYAKGKNQGICKCQHTKKLYSEKPQKIKKERMFSSNMKDHPLYRRWHSIKQRCYRENDKDYPNYGGRGISMCREWRYNFWKFADWADDNGYEQGLTIDRIDVDGNYCPENCRWVTKYEQNQNKKNVPLYNGLTLPDYCTEHEINELTLTRLLKEGLSLEEATKKAKQLEIEREFNSTCLALDVDPCVIRKRMEKGLSFHEAVDFRGNFSKHVYAIEGVQKPLSEWCELYGITPPAVRYRMKQGMTFEEAITKPTDSRGRPKK